jgi:hypothetical protein
MENRMIILLFALNFAHFLGDFTPLNRWFIAAKRHGSPAWIVAGHGAVNGALYGIAAWLLAGREAALLAFAVETVSHTLIDILKGRINKLFPAVENPAKAIYRTIMGADQLLHQSVLIFIVYLLIEK